MSKIVPPVVRAESSRAGHCSGCNRCTSGKLVYFGSPVAVNDYGNPLHWKFCVACVAEMWAVAKLFRGAPR